MSKKRRRHSPEQIVRNLRDADAMLAAGKSAGEVLQAPQSQSTSIDSAPP